MKKRWFLAVGLILLLVAGLTGCSSGAVGAGSPANFPLSLNSQPQGISVGGQGKVTVVPDVATLRLGISAQAASVVEAESQASEAMNRVMAALADNGVAKKDVKTTYFSIRQVTRWNSAKDKEEVIGYRVDNTVNAKIREVETAGEVIDAVVAAGGDLTRINGISFSVDDPSAYYQEAREKAIADARDKAEQLAKLGGVKLGQPTYISEGSQVPPVIYRDMYLETGAMPAPAPAPPPISPGEMEISLTVQVVYAILL